MTLSSHNLHHFSQDPLPNILLSKLGQCRNEHHLSKTSSLRTRTISRPSGNNSPPYRKNWKCEPLLELVVLWAGTLSTPSTFALQFSNWWQIAALADESAEVRMATAVCSISSIIRLPFEEDIAHHLPADWAGDRHVIHSVDTLYLILCMSGISDPLPS
jgi:hypothetical protein